MGQRILKQNFQRELLAIFKGFIHKLDKRVPREVQSWEKVCRYLRHSKDFHNDNTVRPRAFQPIIKDGKGYLSIYRIHGWREKAIRECGEYVVSQTNGKLYGRANLKVTSFLQLELSLYPDKEEPRRHTNITGNTEKAEWKTISKELAYAAGKAIVYE